MNWLNSPAINVANIASRLGISRQAFNNKRKGNEKKGFTPEELVKLEAIRIAVIAEINQ